MVIKKKERKGKEILTLGFAYTLVPRSMVQGETGPGSSLGLEGFLCKFQQTCEEKKAKNIRKREIRGTKTNLHARSKNIATSGKVL